MKEINNYFWNHLDLSTPVILSSRVKCFNSVKLVGDLKMLMNEIKKTIDDLKQLNVEAATLSRLIYRTKHKLRQEKSFKALQKINRCLTNYLTMHLPFVFSSIRDTLYDDFGPTKQMVEWALVRLLGAAHLFNRVYHLCVDAAGHLYVKIKLAHVLELTFFAIATVSRIWTLAQFLVRKFCDWYRRLHQFLDVVEPSPVPWLPGDVVLPSDVLSTLDNPHYINHRYISKPQSLLTQLDNSQSDSDNQLPAGFSSIFDNDDDLGELISRYVPMESWDKLDKNAQNNGIISSSKENQEKTIENEELKELSKSSKQYKHSVDEIQSYDDLIQFYKIESFSRKNSSNTRLKHQCLLGHVDKLQWVIIKKFLKKQMMVIKKSPESNQEKLLKNLRENINKWIA